MSAFAPVAFASSTIHISGNGAGSNNSASVWSNYSTNVSQNNSAHISNWVSSNANSGGNKSNFNTGGTTMVHSGGANSSVQIHNQANMNHLSIGQSTGHTGGGSGHGMMHPWSWFHTSLSGNQEVPGPGDSNGFGTAQIKLHPESGQMCASIWVSNITPATAAHIHKAPQGQSGPVVISLPTPDANGYASSCMAVDSNLLKEIKNNPSHFYVNIHNAEYPNGAVRGQL